MVAVERSTGDAMLQDTKMMRQNRCLVSTAFCDRGSVCVRAPSIEKGARTDHRSEAGILESSVCVRCVRPGDGTITNSVLDLNY